MAEPTTNYIDIDGEGKWIEDTAAREGVAQNAADITALKTSLNASVMTSALTLATQFSSSGMTDNTAIKIGKLAILNIFIYNGDNPFTSGVTIGTLKQELWPKVKINTNILVGARFGALYGGTISIDTDGTIVLYAQALTQNVGELSIRNVCIPLKD